MNTSLYTYYPNGNWMPCLVPYLKMLNMKKKAGRKQLIQYKLSWLRTLCYKNQEWSYKDLYNWAKKQGMDIDDQLILDTLKSSENEVKNWNDENSRKILFYSNIYFVWNMQELYKKFNDKNEIKKWKKIEVIKVNREKNSKKKESMVKYIIENNNGISKLELCKTLKGKVSINTINNILDRNNIKLESKSKASILIENKLDDLFKYRIDAVSKRITYDLLAVYTGVSLKTMKRFIISNNKYKVMIDAFNKRVKINQYDGI